METAERLTFIAEWFHTEANISKSFYLFYYPGDNNIEIFDQKTKKTFLKRIKLQTNQISTDFYVGAKLNIYGRQFEIIDYGDQSTKNILENTRQKTLCILKSNTIQYLGDILNVLLNSETNKFMLNNCFTVQLNELEASEFYEHRGGTADNLTPFLIENLSNGMIFVMELITTNAVEKLKSICGPENPTDAKEYSPGSLRARYGEDLVRNGIYCSESNEQANRNRFKNTSKLRNNCAVGCIKPHAIREGNLGKIITMIQEHQFRINAMKMFTLERQHGEEFYEIYKGVAPEFVQMAIEISSGPMIAMEIEMKNDLHHQQSYAYKAFRELCGPSDSEIARQLRPNTIRARFGLNKVQNAIHCTDLEEDTLLEIEYFFKILP